MPHLSTSRVIPANEYRRVRWRNGAGWTREIHAEPGDVPHRGRAHCGDNESGSAWAWRLSIAEIQQAAAFSRFASMRRLLVLLRGESLVLDFDDGERCVLPMSPARLEFDGARPLVATPGEGVTHVFNAIWDPDVVDVQLLHRPLVGPMLFFAQPGEGWALYLLSGQAVFDGASDLPPMAAGDTAVLQESRRRRLMLDGGGELLALRMRMRD